VIIEKVSLFRLKVPLKRPYKIATAQIKEYDFTLVVLQADDREGIGEAMADIKGYFWETAEEVWKFARKKGGKLLGLDLVRAHEYICGFKKDQPCATTPFLTSIEMLSESPALMSPSKTDSVSIVGILQATSPEEIEKELKEFISSGYTTIKVKVGFDVNRDITRVKIAQNALQHKALIRVDANQGYTLSQAKKFVKNIDPQNIEFFEQPFKENEWEAMVELSKISPLPLGLDESIYGMKSVEKAYRLECARFVKFKMMKIGSAEALAEHIEKSKNYGFEVILGNGAAGEISCYHEALISNRMITRTGEMNGFLKQKESILAEGLKMQGGKLILDPNFALKLDPQKVEKYAVDHLSFG